MFQFTSRDLETEDMPRAVALFQEYQRQGSQILRDLSP